MKEKIFLSGGGTLGSVMPLVALWERVGEDFECIWIGSRKGIERVYIEGLGIKYRAITSAKFRRYLSPRTFFTPLLVFLGFLESLVYLLYFRPKAIVVSGSFISVPLVWAGWLLRVKIVAHQEDIRIGLAGKLTLPFASVKAFAFEETIKSAGGGNKIWIGNPVRKIFKNPKGAEKWKGGLPLILVLGGGLGAQKLNEEIIKIAPEFNGKARILHLTGKNKTIGNQVPNSNGYEQMEFLGDELAEAMAASALIVSRAGLSTLGEIAALAKPSILIPLSGVGQLENAAYFEKHKAAILLQEKNIGQLEKTILEILSDEKKREEMAENAGKIFPADAAEKLALLVN